MTHRLLVLLLLGGGLALAAGCGGGSEQQADGAAAATEESAAVESTVLHLSTDEGGALVFDKNELDAPAGEITIVMENPAPEIHNVSVEGDEIETADGEFAQPDETSTVTVTLTRGTYVFYCAVPGHRASGMVGTLTVS